MRTVVTHSPSISKRFAKLALSLMRIDFKHNPPRWQKLIERRKHSLPMPMSKGLRRGFDIQEQLVNGRPVFTISPRESEPVGTILYTHGGAYVNTLSIFHWMILQALAENVGARLVVPAYPLAPEQTYQAAFDQLEIIYRNLLDTYPQQPLFLCGDSAGGGLALAQALYYRELGLPMPQRIVLFSPWLDLSMSNPAAATLEKRDILLGIQVLVTCGQWWAGAEDVHAPLLSPLFGDLSNLPPVDIFQIGRASCRERV